LKFNFFNLLLTRKKFTKFNKYFIIYFFILFIDITLKLADFLNFNNKYCPRDASDQVKYLKNNISLNNIKKNDIIYWKGHVAIEISKKKIIHAYHISSRQR